MSQMNQQPEYLHQYAQPLPETEGRKKIASLSFTTPLEEFIKSYYSYGVEFLRSSEELGKGDCKRWAYAQVDLPFNRIEYTDRERILRKEDPNLRPTHELSEGKLVAYFTSLEDLTYDHCGVCVTHDDLLLVESRWGFGGDLFRHPLEILPHKYGNFVEFLEVIKERS